MGERRFLDYDPILGHTEYFTYDDTTDGFTIETVQDVEPLVELNKALWNNTEKHTKYGDLTRVASIPSVVLMELSKQGIVTPAGRVLDQKKFRRWLNDSENRCFRTRAGKI